MAKIPEHLIGKMYSKAGKIEPRWIKEFGEDYEVPDIVEEFLEDVSWHNNVSPSFSADNDYTTLWVDHPDPSMREMEGERYWISRFDQDEPVWSGDDVVEAMEAYFDAMMESARIQRETFILYLAQHKL